MRTKQFTASHGVTFTVISLAPGETGPNPYRKSDTHAHVEFHDARYADGHEGKPSHFTEHGQFVSHYDLNVILDGVSGLMLDTGSPDWFIDTVTMATIRSWLTSRTLAERVAEDGITADVAVDDQVRIPSSFVSGTRGWRVTLHHGERTLAVPFFQGPAHTEDPTLVEVLDVLLSDASSYISAQDFDDWASEFGFDPETDARGTWRRTYNTIGTMTDDLRDFLDGKLEDYLWRTESE